MRRPCFCWILQSCFFQSLQFAITRSSSGAGIFISFWQFQVNFVCLWSVSIIYRYMVVTASSTPQTPILTEIYFFKLKPESERLPASLKLHISLCYSQVFYLLGGLVSAVKVHEVWSISLFLRWPILIVFVSQHVE